MAPIYTCEQFGSCVCYEEGLNYIFCEFFKNPNFLWRFAPKWHNNTFVFNEGMLNWGYLHNLSFFTNFLFPPFGQNFQGLVSIEASFKGPWFLSEAFLFGGGYCFALLSCFDFFLPKKICDALYGRHRAVFFCEVVWECWAIVSYMSRFTSTPIFNPLFKFHPSGHVSGPKEFFPTKLFFLFSHIPFSMWRSFHLQSAISFVPRCYKKGATWKLFYMCEVSAHMLPKVYSSVTKSDQK